MQQGANSARLPAIKAATTEPPEKKAAFHSADPDAVQPFSVAGALERRLAPRISPAGFALMASPGATGCSGYYCGLHHAVAVFHHPRRLGHHGHHALALLTAHHALALRRRIGRRGYLRQAPRRPHRSRRQRQRRPRMWSFLIRLFEARSMGAISPSCIAMPVSPAQGLAFSHRRRLPAAQARKPGPGSPACRRSSPHAEEHHRGAGRRIEQRRQPGECHPSLRRAPTPSRQPRPRRGEPSLDALPASFAASLNPSHGTWGTRPPVRWTREPAVWRESEHRVW
jgi:hypothetical protein